MNFFFSFRSRRQAGFSLVEIMITLVVLAIGAGLASPALLAMAPNMALKTAARDLYSRLYEAKMLAIKNNRRISVRFDAANSFYYIDVDGSGSYTPSATDTFTDANGDGAYNPGEAYRDIDGNTVYSGETAVNFKDYGYGIDLGSGNALKNWNGDACAQAGVITFNSRGTSGTGTVYLENRDRDVSFAVTVISAGAIKARKYSGATPFDLKYWN
jgi:prepilin-type N-terminal cleavage/methylation domain-containing protein